MTSPDSMTGAELGRLRRTAQLSARQVAERIGVSRSRIANLEGAAHVQPQAARKVLQAIAELRAERGAE